MTEIHNRGRGTDLAPIYKINGTETPDRVLDFGIAQVTCLYDFDFKILHHLATWSLENQNTKVKCSQIDVLTKTTVRCTSARLIKL